MLHIYYLLAVWKGGICKKLSIPGFQHGSRKNKSPDSKTSIFGPEERTFISTFPPAFLLLPPLLPPWVIKTQGRRLFPSLFIFISPIVGRGIRLFKSSCPRNNLTLHFWAFSFINLQNRKLTLASILLHIQDLTAAQGVLKCSLKPAAWNSTIHTQHEKPGKIKHFLI